MALLTDGGEQVDAPLIYVDFAVAVKVVHRIPAGADAAGTDCGADTAA